MNTETNNDKNELIKKELDRKIANEETKMKLLDQLQLDFDTIKKSVSRCVDLMSNSVQSEDSKLLYEDLHNLNNKLYKDSKKTLDNDVTCIRAEISKYNEEKNKLNDEKKSN